MAILQTVSRVVVVVDGSSIFMQSGDRLEVPDGVPVAYDKNLVTYTKSSVIIRRREAVRNALSSNDTNDKFDPTQWPEKRRKGFEKSVLGKFKEYKESLKQKVRTVRCL